MSHYPVFDEAIVQFQTFLAGQNQTGRLIWIWREDVLLADGNCYLRTVDEADAARLVRNQYDAACARRLGVALHLFCRRGPDLCCCVYWPKDQEDQDYKLMRDGLRLSCFGNPVEAKPVSNPIRWLYLRWHAEALNRRQGWLHPLESRRS